MNVHTRSAESMLSFKIMRLLTKSITDTRSQTTYGRGIGARVTWWELKQRESKKESCVSFSGLPTKENEVDIVVFQPPDATRTVICKARGRGKRGRCFFNTTKKLKTKIGKSKKWRDWKERWIGRTVPVWAEAIRSRPPVTMGIEYFWTGVGFS